MTWIPDFPCRIRRRRFLAKVKWSEQGREKRGDWAVFGCYINKCMKVLVVVYEDFACDFNLIMTCQHC